MRTIYTLGLTLLLLVSGCGMKGGLYLPEPAAEPAGATADAAETESQ
jgi:predicted small lipoprotein YifL